MTWLAATPSMALFRQPLVALHHRLLQPHPEVVAGEGGVVSSRETPPTPHPCSQHWGICGYPCWCLSSYVSGCKGVGAESLIIEPHSRAESSRWYHCQAE